MSFFITFEGIDGCGKTTQLRLLRDHLSGLGHNVVTTREPGGTALAEAIRDYLLHSSQPLAARTELLLFGAARAQHVAELIRPALMRGDVVLCDRFADSSLAYQCGGLGLPLDFATTMNAFATGELQPHLTFLLDVDPAIGQQRRQAERPDRIEERGLEFQERVRAAFLALAQAAPERIVVIDATPDPVTIQRSILQVLQERGVMTEQEQHLAHDNSRPPLQLLNGGMPQTPTSKTKKRVFAPPLPAIPIPNDLEAEQAVLGSILAYPGYPGIMPQATKLLSATDFYRDLHRKIFSTACTLHQAGKIPDIINVAALLRLRGQLETTGGTAYLTALVEVGIPGATFEEAAHRVKETSLLRQQMTPLPPLFR